MSLKWTHQIIFDCFLCVPYLETLNTMVDKINVMIDIIAIEDNMEKLDATEIVNEDMQRIHIPVFLQLDIPSSWDKTNVFEAVDEMRLNGTPEMNIKIKAISSDDLNIFAEMTKNLLCNVHELRSKIDKMMSTLLSEAAIDTTEHAQVGVNVTVPEGSGVNKKFEGIRFKKIQEDVVAVKFFREAIKSAVVEYVSDLLHIDIQENICRLFRLKKSYLIKDILTHLAETEDFGQIKSFIEDPRAFAEVWITKLIFEKKSNEMNLLTSLAHARISSIFFQLSKSVYLTTRSTETSISVWIKEFVDKSNHSKCLPLSTSTFVHVTDRYLPDLQLFIEMVNTQFYEIEIENDVLESFRKEHTNAMEN